MYFLCIITKLGFNIASIASAKLCCTAHLNYEGCDMFFHVLKAFKSPS